MVGVALLCFLCSEQLVYATGDCIRNKAGIKKQKGQSVAGSNYARNVSLNTIFLYFEFIMLELIELLY